MHLVRSSSLLVINIAIYFALVLNSTCDDEKLYTPMEKMLLKKFYSEIKQDLTLEIMHENKYLIRYLRAQNHDIGKAEIMLRRTIEWRNETKMDNILLEDWSSWIRKYPISLNIRDFEGRPTMSTVIGRIDFRKHVLNGKKDELDRYILYCYERSLYNIHHVSKLSGKEFVDGYLLLNLFGYTPQRHACLACMPSWVKLIQNYERHYPQSVTRIIMINTPKIFQQLFQILKPLLTPHTAKAVRVYDVNKEEWKRELLKIFPENNLPPEFGGTRPHVRVTTK